MTGGHSTSSAVPIQLVQPDGQRVRLRRDHLVQVADVDIDGLRSLYTDMVLARRVDNEAFALARQGQLALWTPLLGQEAAQVGSARALRHDDYVFGTYRDAGVALCRGADPVEIVRQWRGVAHSGWDPAELRMATPNIIIGAQALHAVGYAYGAMVDESDIVTIVYFGDGAMSQGDVGEALTFAAHWSAPVVFFCENNQWAISEPVSVQSSVPMIRRAEGYGIPGVQVDGNDVLAVLAVTRRAVARVRDGEGPSFIEAITYRMGPHTTSDDPTRYRPAAELELWRARDPIDRLRRLLDREGGYDDAFAAQLEARADKVADRLRNEIVAMPDPAPSALLDHVYATPHPRIVEQRRELSQFLAEVAP